MDQMIHLERLFRGAELEEVRWMILWDIGIGLSWLLGDPSRTEGHAYDAARSLGRWLPGYPVRWSGALILLLVAGLLLASWRKRPKAGAVFISLLWANWWWWSAMYAFGVTSGGGFVAFFLAAAFARRHRKIRASLQVL